VGAAVIALGIAVACAEPTRPRFDADPSAPDTSAPRLDFLAPLPGDSVQPSGQEIVVQVRVTDNRRIQSIAAAVAGAVNFAFPSLFPDDSIFEAGFPISVPSATAGRIVIRIVATDTTFNVSSAARAFVIQ
jgi:hypothetical protein